VWRTHSSRLVRPPIPRYDQRVEYSNRDGEESMPGDGPDGSISLSNVVREKSRQVVREKNCGRKEEVQQTLSLETGGRDAPNRPELA